MTRPIPLFAAFIAGFLSFISPSVVVLIPGYVAFVAGAARQARWRVSTVGFVAAFSVTPIVLASTRPGALLSRHMALLGAIAGAVVLLAGLHTMGVATISKLRTYGLDAIAVGAAFALAWTPAGSRTLDLVLALAAQPDGQMTAVPLLAVYAAGLAIPFVLTAAAVDQFLASVAPLRRDDSQIRPDDMRYDGTIEFAAGTAMMVMGLLMLTSHFAPLARLLAPYLPTF